MTSKQVAFIENWINNYPKKILVYDLLSFYKLANLELKFAIFFIHKCTFHCFLLLVLNNSMV